MEWTILLMLSRPETQTKLQQEIDNVLGTRPPSLADRQSMPYCEALIEEVMRMSPLTFFAVPHMTSRDTKIGQHFCPKGTTVSSILLTESPHQCFHSAGDVVHWGISFEWRTLWQAYGVQPRPILGWCREIQAKWHHQFLWRWKEEMPWRDSGKDTGKLQEYRYSTNRAR